jgi:hypothetical protein
LWEKQSGTIDLKSEESQEKINQSRSLKTSEVLLQETGQEMAKAQAGHGGGCLSFHLGAGAGRSPVRGQSGLYVYIYIEREREIGGGGGRKGGREADNDSSKDGDMVMDCQIQVLYLKSGAKKTFFFLMSNQFTVL